MVVNQEYSWPLRPVSVTMPMMEAKASVPLKE